MTAPTLSGAQPVRPDRAPAPSKPGTSRGAAGFGPSAPLKPAVSLTAETYLAIGVVVIVSLLIVPLPAMALDALLALSIGLSILVLLVAVSSNDPLEFSVFPSLLLLITLLRLGLNVSSTRLILSHAQAGRVIDAFGNFVIGGNYVVGLVIFLILVAINFMVITKGAGRIAEVAARFTLDAMPGRQMSIDADLSAGLIDETEARARREEISRYADFYGSMDGAAKFVRGDAAAGLVITAINLIGGFIIGMTQQGLTATESLATYTRLTVGDGLVTQIPALIVSTAAGMLVTYGSSNPAMGPTIGKQLARSPRTMYIAAGILAVFAIVPGLPPIPFLLLSIASAVVGYLVGTTQAAAAEAERVRVVESMPSQPAHSAPIRELLAVEPLELEIGYALVPLVDDAQSGDLLKRVSLMRQKLAVELGIVIPPARIRDNIQLPATEYAIKVRGVRVAGGEVMPRFLLALNSTGAALPIEGIQTTDPSFGMAAVWITPELRLEAESMGYTVVEATVVLATHLTETVRQHGADLLTRQHTRELLDGVKESHPALVDDVVPNKLSLGTVHRVLQRLLREGLPIRDLLSILEALSDGADQTKDPELLTEHVRRALGSVILQLYEQGDGSVRGITVGPRLEAALMQLFSPRPLREGGGRTMDPDELTDALRRLNDLVTIHKNEGHWPALIAPPSLRVGIRRLIEPVLPKLPVLSLGELPTQAPVLSLATWELARAN